MFAVLKYSESTEGIYLKLYRKNAFCSPIF